MAKKRRLISGTLGGTKSRHRDRSPHSGEEVLSARDRFKGALQDLLPHSEEEDDDSDSTDDDRDRPNKRLSTIRKKQMEKPVEQEQSGFRLPFVMKLFDRSVDLAQFSEQTPLYPICRAWIANQPHQMLTYNNFVKKRSQSPCPKEDPEPVVLGDNDSDICKDVYRLPLPNTPIYGNNKIRVPEITKYHSRFNKMDQDGIEPPTREQLLQDNLSHWTNVRQSWLDACAKNEARYKQSFRVLLAIFNKAQRQFQS